jgi:hypothetical protein
MSYENPEEARAKRAEKEVAGEAKGKAKLGRKRKSVTPEPEEATADRAKRGHWSEVQECYTRGRAAGAAKGQGSTDT